MTCSRCGQQNIDGYLFCTRCGLPLKMGLPKSGPAKPKKALMALVGAVTALIIIALLVLLLPSNPVAGKWYSQSGTELIMLQNGKGFTVSGDSGSVRRTHFMYAIEYREEGYIEGEIYEKDSGASEWFYLYDGALELGGEYFYRQRPAAPAR